MLEALQKEIIDDLTVELRISDEQFNDRLLEAKVKAVVREVKADRNYPSDYSERLIEDDMNRFYSQMRSLALYDYNMIGVEGQKSASENGIARSYVDRKSLKSGIVPIGRVV